MSSLADRVRAKLAFDKKAATRAALDNPNGGDYYYSEQTHMEGAEAERARTADIEAALVECVEALEKYSYELGHGFTAREALAKLEKVAGK